MGDFFDFNKDGKLDSYERSMKHMYIIESTEELKKQNSTSGYRSSSPKKNDFNPDSAGDNILSALGAAVLAVGAGFLGYHTINFTKYIGVLSYLAAGIFGVVALCLLIKGIALAVDGKRRKDSLRDSREGSHKRSSKDSPTGSGNGKKGIIIGVIVIVLAIVGIFLFRGTGKGTSSQSAQQKSVTGTPSNQDKTPDPATKGAAGTVEKDTEKNTEKNTETKDRWDDYPAKYREIFRAAESEDLVPSFSGNEPEKNYLEWIEELKLPGNAFAEFIAKKRDALKLSSMNRRDRAMVYLLLCETVYGYFDPMNQKIQAVVATGYSADGKSDRENKLTYGKDNYWYARAIYMNDDKNIYLYYGQGLVKGHGSVKDDDIDMTFHMEIDSAAAKNYVNMNLFKKDGHVTPENVTEDFGSSPKPKYSQVKFKMSKDLKELLYVFGVYVSEIVYPREQANEAAQNTTTQNSSGTGKSQGSSSGSSTTGSGSKSGTGSKSGSSSGKTTKKEIDPDDLDIEGYYEDYKEEFESIDDAWDDLMDNPDLWEDYEQ